MGKQAEKPKVPETIPENFADEAQKLLEEAEAGGELSNFLFKTTLERYITQIGLMVELKKAIKQDGMTVTKSYQKGKDNLYPHPCITEYNKTSTAANGTVTTLVNILKNLEGKEKEAGTDLMAKMQDLLEK